MSKFNGFVGDEKPLPLLLLLTTAVDPELDFLILGDVGVRLHDALLLMMLPLLLLLLLLLVIRSDTSVL